MRLRRSLTTIGGQKGFTLLELLLVIAILGVLASIGVGEFINRRKQAYDKQALAKTREWLTVATVAVANQELTSIGSDGGTGPPTHVAAFSQLDMNPPIHWAYNQIAATDVWEFYLASASGETAYYFWIPGPACSTEVDGHGYLSDAIVESTAWRPVLGLP
ncbi:MAG TPA: type II secretion system protein [Syntrophobacteria bacterium]|nr:type II secretion system protein [Syntrophobacteria bacterium]